MSLNARKIVWIVFLISTIISSFMILYTYNVYFGVYRAIRLVNVSVKGFRLSFSDDAAWTETNLTIENPTKYTFIVEFFEQELYLNSLDSKGYIFTAYQPKTAILNPFSNFNITFKIIIPEHKIHMIISANKRTWLAVFFITIEKPPFFDKLTLTFHKILS